MITMNTGKRQGGRRVNDTSWGNSQVGKVGKAEARRRSRCTPTQLELTIQAREICRLGRWAKLNHSKSQYINIDVAKIMDFSVEFYETVAGRCPVREFLDALKIGKRSDHVCYRTGSGSDRIQASQQSRQELSYVAQ